MKEHPLYTLRRTGEVESGGAFGTIDGVGMNEDGWTLSKEINEMQWLIVSIIVVTCGVLALHRAMQWARSWLRSDVDTADGLASCNRCGGCGHGSTRSSVQLVKLGTKNPS